MGPFERPKPQKILTKAVDPKLCIYFGAFFAEILQNFKIFPNVSQFVRRVAKHNPARPARWNMWRTPLSYPRRALKRGYAMKRMDPGSAGSPPGFS